MHNINGAANQLVSEIQHIRAGYIMKIRIELLYQSNLPNSSVADFDL